MKYITAISLLLFAGCAQNSPPTKVASAPTAAPSPTSKPTAEQTAAPPTPEIAQARSRDGRLEATGTLWNTPTLRGSVEISDAKTRRVLASWKDKEGVTGLSFSPDKTLLAVNNLHKLTVWNWRTKKRLCSEELKANGSWIHPSSDFSPNGQWLAVSDNDGVLLFDTRSWRKRRFHIPDVPHVVFTPDSRFVLASQWDSLTAYSLIPVQGVRMQDFPPHQHTEALGTPLFSSNGHLMILGLHGFPDEVQIWSLPRMRLLRKFALPDDDFVPIALSPNAKLLAVCRTDLAGKSHIAVQRLHDGKTMLSLAQECDSLIWANNQTLKLQIGQTTKRKSINGGAR